MYDKSIDFRELVRESDCISVRHIVQSTGFFSEEEVEIAVDLVRQRLAQGTASGYHFLFAEAADRTLAYTCYGRIPGTLHSYDLYWIAVLARYQGMGVGRLLLTKTQELAAAMGALRLYAETSSRERYDSTRHFYKMCGFEEEVVLKDFYAPGDSKTIYVKSLITDSKGPLDRLHVG
jgi:GNAT superfamily N-acetyltransferase